MRLIINLSLFLFLMVACGGKSTDKGDHAIAPENGTAQTVPTSETIPLLEVKSIERLVDDIALSFEPDSFDERQLISAMDTMIAEFRFQDFSYYRSPGTLSDKGGDLKTGSPCGTIYAFGSENMSNSDSRLDLIVERVKKLMAGETNRPESKATYTTIEPEAYGTYSYTKSQPAGDKGGVSNETVTIGRNTTGVLFVVARHESKSAASEKPEFYDRCAMFFDFNSKTMTKSCSVAYYNPYTNVPVAEQNDSQVRETFDRAAYSYSYDVQLNGDRGRSSASVRISQLDTSAYLFRYDFRDYYSKDQQPMLYDVPYSFAEGLIRYTYQANDSTRLNGCTVEKVVFSE